MIIRGKVLEQSGNSFVPVAGADVVVSGIWRTLPEVATQRAGPPLMVNVHPPLYHDRSPGTLCQMGQLNAVGTQRMVLLEHASQGTTKLHVSNASQLRPTNLIRIGGNRPDRAEVMAIVSMQPTTAIQPSWVTVAWPLVWAHSAQTTVEQLNPSWSTPPQGSSAPTVSLEGHKGESCMFVDSTNQFVRDPYVKIGDGLGTIPFEYHRHALFHATTQQGGEYRLPVLQRVAQLEITVSQGPGRGKTLKWQPDYSLPINQVDIVLS